MSVENLVHPRASLIAWGEGMRAGNRADKVVGGSAHNDSADAFRHALWNYSMTQRLGSLRAKQVADAYEIRNPGPENETVMDLWNNAKGRELALDPANYLRNPEEVIFEAIEEGDLWLHTQ
jgi:hypothetical protein